MRVLITGGAGHVGKAMTQRFIDHGWDVHVIGVDAGIKIAGATYAQCDILHYDDLREQMRGCHAVVHLAAIPSANKVPGSPTFTINAAGTFNVFEAADAEGIKRIAQASSINALGSTWGMVDIAPRYFPVDEEHPTYTTDPYSFSKGIVEEIGAYYWRRSGITSVALRFPYVYPNADLHSDKFLQQRAVMIEEINTFRQLPEAERQQQFDAMREKVIQFRQERGMEKNILMSSLWPKYPTDSWLWRVCLFERFDFWAYVDDRDAAQAAEKSLTADFEGSHALFINAANNRHNYDSQTLVRLFYPAVTTFKQPLTGAGSLVSIARARQLIGYEPEYSVY